MHLTPKQHEANELLAGPGTDSMLFGGSRSGKTLLILRAIAIRAMNAPGSRHGCFRFRQNDCETKIGMESFPEMMAGFFPTIPYHMNKEYWYATLPMSNPPELRSEIWFGGLDDKQRTEKMLGGEFATLFLNECSQISWTARNMVRTRLAQKVRKTVGGEWLSLRMYYDMNPPRKKHWTHSLFVRHVDPDTKRPLESPSLYPSLLMNPEDNRDNLPAEYLDVILPSFSARYQRRFRYGMFEDDTAGILFGDEDLDKWRVLDGRVPDFQRIVIAIDPSGSGDTDNADNDAIGIIVAALGTDGNGYVLEDLTVKAGPATWGRIATTAFERHGADKIVAEVNYGGAMVRAVIEAARPRTPYRALTASRGKVVRAEPVASLVEAGKVRLVGYFPELEEELGGFTTNGYTGDGSPNRGDAFVWAMSELFPGIVGHKEETPRVEPARAYVLDGYGSSQSNAWMGS